MTLEKSPFFNNLKVSKLNNPNNQSSGSAAASLFHSKLKSLNLSKDKEPEDKANYTEFTSPNPEKISFKHGIKNLANSSLLSKFKPQSNSSHSSNSSNYSSKFKKTKSTPEVKTIGEFVEQEQKFLLELTKFHEKYLMPIIDPNNANPTIIASYQDQYLLLLTLSDSLIILKQHHTSLWFQMKNLDPNGSLNSSEKVSSIISQCVQDIEPVYKDYCQAFFQTYQAFCQLRPLVKATANILGNDTSLHGPQLFLYRPLERLLGYKKQISKIEKRLQDRNKSEETQSEDPILKYENLNAPSSQDLEQLLESSFTEYSELEKLKRLEKILQVADRSIHLSDQHRKLLLETKFSVVSCKCVSNETTTTSIAPKKVLGILLSDRLILVTNDSKGIMKRDKVLINLERVDLLNIQSHSLCIVFSLPGTIDITLLAPSQDLRDQWLENLALVQQNQKMFYSKVTSLSTLKFSQIYSPQPGHDEDLEADQIESTQTLTDSPTSSSTCPPLANNPDSSSTTSDDHTEFSEPTTPRMERASHRKQYERHSKRTSSALIPDNEKSDIETSGIPCYLSRPCLLFTSHGDNSTWNSMGNCIVEIRRQGGSEPSFLCIRSHPSMHTIARLPILAKTQLLAQLIDDDMIEIQVKGGNFYRFSKEDHNEAKQMIQMVEMEQVKYQESSKFRPIDLESIESKRFSMSSAGTESPSVIAYSRGNSLDQSYKYTDSPKPSSIISNDSLESAKTDNQISLTRSSSRRAVPSTPRSASLMPRELSQQPSMTSIVSHPSATPGSHPKATITTSCLISIPCKFFAQDTSNGAGGKWVRVGHTQLRLYKETKTYDTSIPNSITRPPSSDAKNVRNTIKLIVETIENPSKNKPSMKMISCNHHNLRAELSGKRGINRKIALLVEDQNHRIRTYLIQVKDKGIADQIIYWIARVPQQDPTYA